MIILFAIVSSANFQNLWSETEPLCLGLSSKSKGLVPTCVSMSVGYLHSNVMSDVINIIPKCYLPF
jgi:hypothetical protein